VVLPQEEKRRSQARKRHCEETALGDTEGKREHGETVPRQV
jgi:hypothetical protein